MLRKVNTIETLEIPFSVIESQEDGIIVDIPTTMTYDDEGNIISEINPEEYGSPASWMDVNNPLYFDLQIDNKIYSWDGKEGTTKIALDKSGVIGRVKYLPFKVNSKILHTKKVITPRSSLSLCEMESYQLMAILPNQRFSQMLSVEKPSHSGM